VGDVRDGACRFFSRRYSVLTSGANECVFFFAQCGVPVFEDIDVHRYLFELGGGEDSRFLTGPSARFGMTSV